MFPFSSRWRWLIAGRSVHLMEASRPLWDSAPEPWNGILHQRARHLGVWLKVRIALIVLLSPGLVATVLGAIAARVDALTPIVDVLDVVFVVAGSVSLVLTLLFFVASRFIGQLEADLIAALALAQAERLPSRKRK